MKVNKVELKARVGISDTIRYQILTYCFFENIQITDSDLKSMSVLARSINVDIPQFCNELVDKKIFKSSQSARNALTKLEKKKLIIRNGRIISLNSLMNVQITEPVLLNYMFLGYEPKES